MLCPNCGNQNGQEVNFCRTCGTDFEKASLALDKQGALPVKKGVRGARLTKAESKDPDELIANGIGGIIMGDGFFMIAVILSATNASISSLLWLLMLIPAFFYFGKGFADILHAKRICQRLKANELKAAKAVAELPRLRPSVVDIFQDHISGGLLATGGATERTTRELQ
jgi:zinc-ribbon domain